MKDADIISQLKAWLEGYKDNKHLILTKEQTIEVLEELLSE